MGVACLLLTLMAVVARTSAFSSVPANFPAHKASLRHRQSNVAALTMAADGITRGQLLLEKYQTAKGFKLPLLGAEDEAKCKVEVKKVQVAAVPQRTTITAQLASDRVAAAPKKARELTPEEQRTLDEKAGRVERDRSKEHVYDGGWWGKESPYRTIENGGLTRVAELITDLKDPKEEAIAELDNKIRAGIDAARGMMEKEVRGNTDLAKSLIQLAWADAATFTHLGEYTYGARSGVVFRLWMQRKWPAIHGANGSMRFAKEHNLQVNADCREALELIERVRQGDAKDVSYADLIQLGATLGVKALGGPEIEGMLYGRFDVDSDEACAPANRHANRDVKDPIKYVTDLLCTECMFSEEEILALTAPGMLGYSFANPALSGPGRSGPFVMYSAQSTFQNKMNEWSRDEKSFFAAYARAHRRLSDLGAKFQTEQGTSAAVPAKKPPTNLIKGWGGLGVNYDVETLLEEGFKGEGNDAGEVQWNRGKEYTAIFDEKALIEAVGEDDYGYFAAGAVGEVSTPAEMSV